MLTHSPCILISIFKFSEIFHCFFLVVAFEAWCCSHNPAYIKVPVPGDAYLTSYLLSVTSGSVSLTRATNGSGIKAEFEDVKQKVAALLDCIDMSEKQVKEHQEQILKAFQQGGNKSSSSRQSRPQNEHSGVGPNDNCWYNWKPGHYVRDCQNVQKHVAEGLLKLVDKKFMMIDGTSIPHKPAHLCPMDHMLALLNKRQEQMFWEDNSEPAGIFNINVPDNTSLYVNKPQDTRDEVINKLCQDLQYWQTSAHVPTPVQSTIQPQLLQAPVPSTSSQPLNQSFDSNVFLNQMRSLFTQASSQNVTSGQNFKGQYVATGTSGGDSSQQGFESV